MSAVDKCYQQLLLFTITKYDKLYEKETRKAAENKMLTFEYLMATAQI